MLYQPSTSGLLYGGPGSGKTAFAVSSFYDWRTGTPVTENAKLVTFGREDNPALAVPESYRQTEKGTSLRFSSPALDSMDWLEKFEAVTDMLLHEASKGNCLDVLVVDGMSEFDLLFEEVFSATNTGGDEFKKWNALLSQMFAIMMRLDPAALGCTVLVTARVMEKKKERRSNRSSIAGDPDFVDFDYYPSLRGSFRLHFPHYFNYVLYMETQMMRVTEGQFEGKSLPAHILNMVRTGDFYVKNQWEHQWLQAGEELQIINPHFPDVHKRMVNAMNLGVKVTA